MKFFIDTANVEEIRKANDMGIIAGVTTNPSLIAKEGRDYAETLAEIATIVDGPISGEVKATTADAEGMIAEGRAIYALDPAHMVVKIPMTAEGLKAIKVLSAEGIPTNCTLIFSANQALLAARAGATYVSPFLGRLDDIGQPGIELVETIHDMFLNYPDIETQIIAASVRNPIHVTDCALAGADIATVPYKVIEQMLHHPLTDAGIEKFKADYTKVFGKYRQYRIILSADTASEVRQLPERCLSRQAGIVRYCLKYIQKSPPAKQLAGLFFGFLGFRLVAHVRYRVHGDERLGVFAVHEVHQLLVLALVHDGDDLAAFFHVVGTVGFIHRGPAVQVG